MSDDHWNVIDLTDWREQRHAATFQQAVRDATVGLFDELSRVERWIRSDQAPTQEQAAAVIEQLGAIVRTGLFGYHARTWAAALLVELRRRHESALQNVDKVPIVEAWAALQSFDAVAFGTASPDAASKFVTAQAAEQDQGRR